MENKKDFRLLLVSLGLIAMILAGCGAGPTQTAAPTDPPAPTPTDLPAVTEPPQITGNPARGGQLYDEWWQVLEAEAPTGDQPLWATQTTNTRSGGDTWRCKECHGWDYKGTDGAYGSGSSHFTGFPGLMNATTMTEAELSEWLTGVKNPDHDFSTYLGEAQISMLAAFIQEGIVDRSPFIGADKTVNGDAEHGKSLFLSTCTRCHGEDGKEINFGDASEPEFLGTVASDNPWEFFHKGSFGQPGTHMPASLNFGWTLQDIADLLAFAQSLPTE